MCLGSLLQSTGSSRRQWGSGKAVKCLLGASYWCIQPLATAGMPLRFALPDGPNAALQCSLARSSTACKSCISFATPSYTQSLILLHTISQTLPSQLYSCNLTRLKHHHCILHPRTFSDNRLSISLLVDMTPDTCKPGE